MYRFTYGRGHHAKIYGWAKAPVKGNSYLMNKAINTEILKVT